MLFDDLFSLTLLLSTATAVAAADTPCAFSDFDWEAVIASFSALL